MLFARTLVRRCRGLDVCAPQSRGARRVAELCFQSVVRHLTIEQHAHDFSITRSVRSRIG